MMKASVDPEQVFHRHNVCRVFLYIYLFFTYVLVTRRKSIEKATGMATGTGTGVVHIQQWYGSTAKHLKQSKSGTL